MIIEYDISCFERTLEIHFPDEYEHHQDEILKLLDDYYYKWHDAENIADPVERTYVEESCLEEYMMTGLSEIYDQWEMWDSIYYGDSEEEMYETVPVKNVKE